MACTFQGNADVLGIGIRIGYYTQVLAIWFANYFNQGPVPSLRAVNNLFLLALICAGFTYFANARQTQVVEVYLVLAVGLATGVVGITEAGKGGTKYQYVSIERLVIRMSIMVFGATFNVLFWWKALDVMRATPCNGVAKKGAGTYTWYFVRVSLYGWLRIWMQVQSMCAALWTAPIHCSRDVVVLMQTIGANKTRSDFAKATKLASRNGRFSERTLPHDSSQTTTAEGTAYVKQSYQVFTSPKERKTNVFKLTPLHCLDLEPGEAESRAKLEELLRKVQDAEEYMNTLFSIFVKTEPNAEHKPNRLIKLLKRSKKQFVLECTDKTPYIVCLWRLVLMEADFASFKARLVLGIHSLNVGGTSWLRTMNHMYMMKQSKFREGEPHGIPEWCYLKIASDFQLSQMQITRSKSSWTIQAAIQFCFFGVLIVVVEMTIVYNRVTGLNSLSNLGQLIPFILGVGGFVKVIWEKAALLIKGERMLPAPKNDYEVALGEYSAWKGNQTQQFAKQELTRAATA